MANEGEKHRHHALYTPTNCKKKRALNQAALLAIQVAQDALESFTGGTRYRDTVHWSSQSAQGRKLLVRIVVYFRTRSFLMAPANRIIIRAIIICRARAHEHSKLRGGPALRAQLRQPSACDFDAHCSVRLKQYRVFTWSFCRMIASLIAGGSSDIQ